MPIPLYRSLFGELIGTFALTLLAAQAKIASDSHVVHAIVPALAVTALIWSLSGVSGAHINPAVTLAFVIRSAFPPVRALAYVAAQLAGAIAAAFLLRALDSGAIASGMTTPVVPFTTLQALVAEIIATFFLVLTILATTEQKAIVGKNAALAVGSVLAACGLAFDTISGASMNPARSLAFNLVTGVYTSSWIYVVGPAFGAALATGAMRLLIPHPVYEDRSPKSDGRQQGSPLARRRW